MPVAHERWERAARRAESYLAKHPDTFAGDWVSENNGGEYHVAFTRDADEHERALRELLPEPEVLHVHTRPYALADLMAVQARIIDDVNELATGGIFISSTSPDCDRGLSVGLIAPDAEGATHLLRSRYGGPIIVDYLGPDRFVVEPVRWDGCYALSDNGMTLTIYYVGNSCYEFERIEHAADEQEVRVTILERAPVGFQTDVARKRNARVKLESPLGTRRVIDAVGETRRPPCSELPEPTLN